MASMSPRQIYNLQELRDHGGLHELTRRFKKYGSGNWKVAPGSAFLDIRYSCVVLTIEHKNGWFRQLFNGMRPFRTEEIPIFLCTGRTLEDVGVVYRNPGYPYTDEAIVCPSGTSGSWVLEYIRSCGNDELFRASYQFDL